MRLNPLDAILYISLRILKLLDRRDTDLGSFNPAKVRNILLVSSTAIGDTLLSTPAIRAVRERYPKAWIIAHLNSNNMELFENNPHIDGIIPYYGGYKRFFQTIKELRKHRFDLVLIFHGNEPQATPMAYLSGAPFIFKLPNRNSLRFLLSNSFPAVGWEDMEGHGIEQRMKVACLADCRGEKKQMVLPISKESRYAVEKVLFEMGVRHGERLIGFQVAASTLSRMWFPERFIELGKRLVAAFNGIRVVITGSPSERGYCEEIGRGIGDSAVVSAGRIPLALLPALVRRFTLLVTGDTGIMHIAIAVGTSVVALYAVADAKRSGPFYYLERHRIIQKWKTCHPCVSKKCKYQKCMENISVKEVFENIKELLETGDRERKEDSLRYSKSIYQ